MALSKAHDMLTRESWEGANLTEIVSNLIAAHCAADEGRCVATGPDIRISPKVALALSMALHELATNALKYGALSSSSGRINIVWSVQGTAEAPRLKLRWTESGGPAVAPPEKRGFGSRLIERGLAQDISGEARIDFAETGVVCTIDAPLEFTRAGGDHE